MIFKGLDSEKQGGGTSLPSLLSFQKHLDVPLQGQMRSADTQEMDSPKLILAFIPTRKIDRSERLQLLRERRHFSSFSRLNVIIKEATNAETPTR